MKRLSPTEQLLKDTHNAICDVINDWENPDSPEAFVFSMKGIMVMRDRIAFRLGICEQPQPQNNWANQ